ncbi:Rho GTPase-activating protein 35 [Clonorchis sinensis]|uniref:Rho GTPase-activating protein 35 n=2 Tax=Clonorchis sinensis TaxID=79923 RepID=A0A8T1M6P8_CLOSI|nr:Rho GTPase-activating protein 35 [Clonorchis sinensis]
MPNSPRLSQVFAGKTYNISVVGLPRAGKSCLCNRFALPHPDFYREDHLSVLSSVDFRSAIVNCENWIYWGCVSRQVEDYTVNFRIVEHTEFVNASTLQPFASAKQGASQDYIQRCSALRLSSEHKLRYICKDQLGQEELYEQEYFPSGGVEVSGFVLVYDATPRNSEVSSKAPRNCVQRPTIQEFLTHLLKLKKPVVLALSKLDSCSPQWVEELSVTLQKCNEFRRVPVIETSSHKNVNVEQTFLTLVKLIDKPRGAKFRNLHFPQALQEEENKIALAYGAFRNLLSHASPTYLENWEAFMKRYSQQAGVATYVNLVGTTGAQNVFGRYIAERQLMTRQNNLHRISQVLTHFLPRLDSIRNKSIEEIAQYLRDQNEFALYFQDTSRTVDPHGLIKLNKNDIAGCTKLADNRIPFKLVLEPQELHDSPLQLYVNQLVLNERRYLEQARLEAGLQSRILLGPTNSASVSEPTDVVTKCILPGQPMSEVQDIISELQPSDLTDDQISTMYKNFQHDLHTRAREDFLDLLVERTDLFLQAVGAYLTQLRDASSVSDHSREFMVHQAASMNESRAGMNDSSDSSLMSTSTSTGVQTTDLCSACTLDNILTAPPRGIKETHLNWLDQQLSDDWRYQAMIYLPSERQTLVAAQFNLLLPPTTLPLFYGSGHCPVSTRGVSGAHTSSFYHVFSHESLPHCCPSLPWGGCMDHVFKQLVYRFFPLNPQCLEPGLNTDGQCMGQIYGAAAGTSPPTKLPSLTLPALSSELSVAVACVCTDLLASQAIVHLLTCAGFSVNPLLCTRANQSHSMQSEPNFIDDSTYVQQPMQPVSVHASWPLPTDRIPPVYIRTTEVDMSPTIQPTTHPIQNGQVHATLLSLHKFLNGVLQCTTNRTRGSALPMNSGPAYHGYIFVLGISSKQRHLTSTDVPDNTAESGVESVACDFPNTACERSFSPTNSLSTEDGDDNVVTPRPRSDPLFFTDEIDVKQPMSDVPDCPAYSDIHTSCICCSLFNIRQGSLPTTDCACGTCCDCLHSNADASSGGFQTYSNAGLSDHSDMMFSTLSRASYRSRSLDARLSAVRSAMNSLPCDTPRLLLLAKDSSLMANGKRSVSSANPLIFPAPEAICSSPLTADSWSILNEQVGNYPHRDISSDKPQSKTVEDGATRSSEWMPAGTNVLDHVIKFLDQCWNSVAPSTASYDSSTGSHSVRHLPHADCTRPSIYTVPQSSSRTGTGSSGFSATVSEKSPSTGLLGAASATGRRAMQSANQALKKLSSSSKWYHSTNTQSSSNTYLSTNSTLKGACLPLKNTDVNALPGRNSSANNRTSPTCLSIAPAPLRTSGPPSSQKTSPVTSQADSNRNIIQRTLHSSPNNSPTSELPISRIIRSEPTGVGSFSSVNKSATFVKNGLRASIDRTYAFRKAVASSTHRIRSRCSVPDCSSLAFGGEYDQLTRSDRNLSTNTLVLGAGQSPKALNHSLVSGTGDINKFQRTSSNGLCAADSTSQTSLAFINNTEGNNAVSSLSGTSDLALGATPQLCEGSVAHERAIPIPCLSASGPPVSPARSDELDSIYEELNLVSPSQTTDDESARFSYRATCGDTEECNYAEPVDALNPGQLERHRCSIEARASDLPVVNPVISLCANHVPVPKETTVSNTSNWMTAMLGRRRRERHRSFSTPEGCTITVDEDSCPESSEFKNTYDSIPSSSGLMRGTQNQLFASRINPRSQRSCEVARNATFSSGSSSSGIPTTPGSGSFLGCHSPTHQRPFSVVVVSSATSISSPASGLLTGSGFSERVISMDEASHSHSRLPSSSRRLCGSHHHHFWHHTDCPHYQVHRISVGNSADCISTPTTSLASTPETAPYPSIDTSIPWDTRIELIESATPAREVASSKTGAVFRRLKPRPLSRGLASSKRASNSGSVSAIHAAPCVEPIKPIFVDPKDFSVNQPHPVFYLPTGGQTSKSCSFTATSTSSVMPKDSRWYKHGIKFNLFPSHRSTGSTSSSAVPTCSMVKSSTTPTTSMTVSHCAGASSQFQSAVTSVYISDSNTQPCLHTLSEKDTPLQSPLTMPPATQDVEVIGPILSSASQEMAVTRNLRIAAWHSNFPSVEPSYTDKEDPQNSNTTAPLEITPTTPSFTRCSSITAPSYNNTPVCTSRN